jgi:hypothetical protein
MLFLKWKIFANFVTAKFWSGLPVHLKVMKIKLNKAQCCGSGMFIPDPLSWFFIHPGSYNRNKRGEGEFCCCLFFGATNFKKTEIYFIWNKYIKRFEPNDNVLHSTVLFTQTIVTKSSFKKYGQAVRDPRSRKNLSRIQGSKRHWIPDTDLQQS